ncbi:MAG: ABC transporter ATP-binding protein [Chloroflexi bacterium HGW-Chloroflexi-10]|nr:MAG: ABC transporter ATP-binding protein [Chloroflexi bacterium HGW-Chloroflexi-10]
MDALSVSHLEKCYPTFQLRDVSFRVQPGRIMGFIGRNGAGKTTTMKSILNLVHPDRGTIQFFGLDMPAHEFEIKQRIACIFGAANYYTQSPLKVIADVYRRFYPSWDDALYRTYLQRFTLDPNKKLKQLSQGMSIKFALALALSHHAELLILDEPTSGLDPVSRDELLHIFEDIVDREGASIFFSTHITSDLDKNADDITYIKNGEIIASEEKDSFLKSYRKVEGCVADLPPDLKDKMIGFHDRKGAFSGLLREADAHGVSGLNFAPADLETIMVCIERG